MDEEIPEEILGFYTLSIFEISAQKLPSKFAKKYKGQLPAAKLARVAVSRGQQNRGLGRHLVINAIKRIIRISENVGIIEFFVDAKTEEVRNYYQKFGFIQLPEHSLELFLPLATLQQMYETVFNEKS